MTTCRIPTNSLNLLLYSIMNSFGNWIIQEIEERGWSQSELARRSHASRGSISNIVRGTRYPGPEMCNAIAKAFKYPPEYVFKKAGIIPPEKNSTNKTNPSLEEANQLLEELPEDYQKQALNLIRFLHKTYGPDNPKKARSSPR